jgi:hypothetical protein
MSEMAYLLSKTAFNLSLIDDNDEENIESRQEVFNTRQMHSDFRQKVTDFRQKVSNLRQMQSDSRQKVIDSRQKVLNSRQIGSDFRQIRTSICHKNSYYRLKIRFHLYNGLFTPQKLGRHLDVEQPRHGFARHGLLQIVLYMGIAACAADVVGVLRGGEHDDGGVGLLLGGVFLKVLEEAKAVHFGHADVEEDDFGKWLAGVDKLCEKGKPFGGRALRGDGLGNTNAAEKLPCDVVVDFVVVDKEYVFYHKLSKFHFSFFSSALAGQHLFHHVWDDDEEAGAFAGLGSKLDGAVKLFQRFLYYIHSQA